MKYIPVVLATAFLFSCNDVPDKAPRRYIEENLIEGELHFIQASALDSTSLIDKEALEKMHKRFAEDKRFTSHFSTPRTKTIYFTKLLFTITTADGTVDTLRHTIYTDKEQTEIYGIKSSDYHSALKRNSR